MNFGTPESWRADAACRDDDPDELFARGAEQRRAKIVCRTCPVRTPCLAEALDNRVGYGVWGGMTERERRALLRRRPDVTSWAELLAAARDRDDLDSVLAGDLDALAEFEACYKAEFTKLVGFVIKIGYREQDAGDAAQAAFTEAWRQWKTIREPRAWLRKVVRRCLPSRPKISYPEVADLARPQVTNEIEIADQTRIVLGALRKLPYRQRVVMAYTYDGFTPTEIARELDLTPENVRKILQRARETLKRHLPGQGRDRDE